MLPNFPEILGKYVGYIPGSIFATFSLLRRSRVFHPQGYLFEGEVKSDFFPPKVLVRFSSALWKHKEWTDVLGLALRFGQDNDWNLKSQNKYQDILTVTSRHVWSLPLAFFLSKHHDFLANRYFAITPFEFKEVSIEMRILCEGMGGQGLRKDRLETAVNTGSAKLNLQMFIEGQWQTKAEILLTKKSSLDQERLIFTPFHTALGIVPRGFVNYLRLRTYELCQATRLSLISKNLR